jgi:K+-sensing histidine kinase KdpD
MLGGETFSGRLQDIGIASDPWVEHHAADPALCAPIRVLGEWWGILGLVSVDGRWKSRPEDIRLLHTAADLFSVHFERRKTLADREEKNRLAGALEMAGVVCHKLNQPMQVILGYSSMVTSGDIKDPAKVIDVVKLIEDETRQMGIITKNLMGITRIREAVSEETDG